MEPVSEVKCVVGLYFEPMMLVCYIDFRTYISLVLLSFHTSSLILLIGYWVHFLKAFSYQSGPSTLPILGPRVILGWYEVCTYVIMFVWFLIFKKNLWSQF